MVAAAMLVQMGHVRSPDCLVLVSSGGVWSIMASRFVLQIETNSVNHRFASNTFTLENGKLEVCTHWTGILHLKLNIPTRDDT